MVFAVTTKDDLPAGDLGGVRALICDVSGLCHQRNIGLSAVADVADVIAFFDDDYVPSSRCVEGIAAIFAERPDVVAANGVLLADGVNSPGISYADAQTLIDHHDRMPAPAPEIIATLSGLYGCNMTSGCRCTLGKKISISLRGSARMERSSEQMPSTACTRALRVRGFLACDWDIRKL
jgi:hypothetical protein